jgi:outer membrane lipoprotein-sorting protein
MLLWTAAALARPTADEIMSRNFEATKVAGFLGLVEITLINDRNESRERKMLVRSKLRTNGVDSAVLTRFAQPPDIKGTGFLQVQNSAAEDDIWVYLPALGKTRRLAANNKRDSFFGTDFSYGDILLPSVGLYRHTLLREEALEGVQCFVVESVPSDTRTRDETGYSRRLTWVDPDTFVERKVEYYDTKNVLLKTQLISDLKLIEPDKHRWIALNRLMTNHQTGHRTLYTFERFEFQPNLQDGEFSARRLEDE